ncbi:hypothetical protein MdSGHV059 [Musca domestica salivary gland hypertrophy virus]|uniref:Uncharacterized protein n=1 Tax=Musca hytrovirus(isolate Musca domestica/United States/Boucias/-) TaxID=523909 RepID=B2YG36_MHVB|nr:hypothetical protein MdSGHV059 [Musca domestica salivary gland hypertrophy virus]ACD03518.1 hypothetical protein MdSGHV059 [Musca domestica salivary gland hypertrophy virus]
MKVYTAFVYIHCTQSPHKIILPLVFTFRAKFFASAQPETQPKQNTLALALYLHSQHPLHLFCMSA